MSIFNILRVKKTEKEKPKQRKTFSEMDEREYRRALMRRLYGDPPPPR